MKLIFIRHGDPDYRVDGLTSRGQREVAALTDYLTVLPADEYFVSPLGRAQATAAPFLQKTGKTAKTLDWLREFEGRIPYAQGRMGLCWDLLPSRWAGDRPLYDVHTFLDARCMQGGTVDACYHHVCSEWDAFLAHYGMHRHIECSYRCDAERPETLVFFCHLGVQFVILSHLLGISPILLLQGFFVAPTSLTTVVTEERERGLVQWRVQSLGDCTHLHMAGIAVSDAGQFRSVFSGKDGIR